MVVIRDRVTNKIKRYEQCSTFPDEMIPGIVVEEDEVVEILPDKSKKAYDSKAEFEQSIKNNPDVTRSKNELKKKDLLSKSDLKLLRALEDLDILKNDNKLKKLIKYRQDLRNIDLDNPVFPVEEE